MTGTGTVGIEWLKSPGTGLLDYLTDSSAVRHVHSNTCRCEPGEGISSHPLAHHSIQFVSSQLTHGRALSVFLVIVLIRDHFTSARSGIRDDEERRAAEMVVSPGVHTQIIFSRNADLHSVSPFQ